VPFEKQCGPRGFTTIDLLFQFRQIEEIEYRNFELPEKAVGEFGLEWPDALQDVV
jgi:hypothetical protein